MSLTLPSSWLLLKQKIVSCNSLLSSPASFLESILLLFLHSFSLYAALSLEPNTLSDQACWLGTHSYLQKEPQGVGAETEGHTYLHLHSWELPSSVCIWSALLRGTWVNLNDFWGHLEILSISLLFVLLKAFAFFLQTIPQLLLFLHPSTFTSPSAFPICPSLSHIRSVSARIQNMSECRLVTLRFFFLPLSFICLLPPLPSSPAIVNNRLCLWGILSVFFF